MEYIDGQVERAWFFYKGWSNLASRTFAESLAFWNLFFRQSYYRNKINRADIRARKALERISELREYQRFAKKCKNAR